MDILRIILIVALNGAKFLALFCPIVYLVLILHRRQKVDPRICEFLNYFSGGLSALAFYGLALFVRAGVPLRVFAGETRGLSRRALHVPFPNLWQIVLGSHDGLAFKEAWLHFWNDQYFTFWTEALNPFRYPLVDTAVQIAKLPRGNGAIVLLLIGLCAVTSVIIGQSKARSGAKQLVTICLCAILGWWIGALGAWAPILETGPVFLIMLVYYLRNAVPLQYVYVRWF